MSRPSRALRALLPRRAPAPALPAPSPHQPQPLPLPPAARMRMSGRVSGRRTTSFAALGLLLAMTCTSCVLAESKDYVVQPAPPNGIHVTLRPQPTKLLVLVSDLVTAGVAIDRALADKGLHLTCDSYPNVRAMGDRCAFRVLAAARPKGSLVSKAIVALAWGRALAPNELGDFSSDALAAVRRHRGACVHVTIRGLPRAADANWTWRSAGNRGC